MDYITTWLSHHYNSIYTCYDWYSITFHVFLVLIAMLGLAGAIRRRDRPLVGLFIGLFLLFIGDPLRNLGMMLFVHAPNAYMSFFDYVQAQRPWLFFRSVDMNIIKPVGFILAMISAFTLLGFGHGRRIKALDKSP